MPQARRDPEPAPGAAPEAGPLGLAVLFCGVVILLFDLAWVARGVPDLMAHRLLDTDPYARLLRVEALWQHGHWFDSTLRAVSPPDGLVQHWTRLWDGILLAGGAALAPRLGFETGLYWFAALLPVGLHLLALGLVVWAARPVLARRVQWITAFLFVGQAGVLTAFLIGRPDIPPLLLTLFIVHTGLMLRLLQPQASVRTAVGLGLVAALAVWHSIEAVLFVVPGFGALGLAWLAGRSRARAVAEVAAWSTAPCLLLCLLAERGLADFAAVAFDRLALPHVVAFALNALFWSALRLAEGRPDAHRLGVAALVAALVAAVLVALYPGFLDSPIANMDPFYRARRFAFILEYRSVFQPERGWWGGLVVLPATYLLLPLIGLAAALVLRPWRGPPLRWDWLYLLVLLALFTAMTAGALHWAAYAGILAALVATDPVARLLARLRTAPLLVQSAGRVGIILLLVSLPLLPQMTGALAGAGGLPGGEEAARAGCFPPGLIQVLTAPDGLGDRRRLILAHTDSGPELVYRTGHAVLSIPNHRPQPGFRTAIEILSAEDAATAERRVRAAGVDLILLCAANVGERAFFAGDRPPGAVLYDRLAAGDPPRFLQPVPLPGREGEPILRLYRVTPASE